jgi:hypothetical protein
MDQVIRMFEQDSLSLWDLLDSDDIFTQGVIRGSDGVGPLDEISALFTVAILRGQRAAQWARLEDITLPLFLLEGMCVISGPGIFREAH